MKCQRCAAKMFPSQPECDVCRAFTQDDLAQIRRDRGGKMWQAKILGVVGLSAAAVILALVFVGMSGFMWLGLAALAGTSAAKAFEQARMYSQLSRYSELRARRESEARARRLPAVTS